MEVHLNRNNRDSIEAEWELLVLTALASMGHVEHEPDLGGAARLDVRFHSSTLSFVADVTVLSDDTYNAENPVDAVARLLARVADQLRQEGINGGFYFSVDAKRANLREGNYKTRLILPQEHNQKRLIIDAAFEAYLQAIRHDPNKIHHHLVKNEETSISIEFKPGNAGVQSFSYPAYNLAHDPVHNVVHRALKKKADQLKRAGTPKPGELAGVLLCDGGCGMLRAMPSVGVISLDVIIRSFLRKSHTVDWVCVVDVFQSTSFGNEKAPRFDARVWSVRHPAIVAGLAKVVKDGLSTLPSPVYNAVNTLNHYIWAGDMQRRWGKFKRNYTMTHNSVEFSLRAVVDYLSGRIGRDEFEQLAHQDWVERLRNWLDEGRGVANTSINRTPDTDDDGLVITLSDHDAASAPFRVPLGEGKKIVNSGAQ